MKLLLSTSMLFIIVLITPALFAQTEKEATAPETWEPQVAGRFYPGNETALKDQITAFFKNVPNQTTKGVPIAIVSPHAGYQYSGQVAAYGYSVIRDYGFNRVIVLSPSHFMGGKRFRGASVLMVKNFKTPLGLIPVDQDACNQLLNASNDLAPGDPRKPTKIFGNFEGAYQGEHSMETQLPFLQMALGNFKLIPIMVGILIDNDFDQVARAIQPLMDGKTIVVVSSDFTHFGEGYGYVPFKKDIEKNIQTLDYGAFNKIISKDFNGLKAYRKETGINACGIMPLELLLKLLPKEAQGEILRYDTSGHQSDNFSFSVSYASILFTRPPAVKSGDLAPIKDSTGNQQSFLSDQEKSTLLSLARNTLKTCTTAGGSSPMGAPEPSLTPRLKEKYGVFVTLKKGGELRGCIGHIAPREPLFQGVIENTVNSSSKDWRFRPVTAGEISDITIEISVLSPPKMIKRPDEFVVGREGIIIRKGHANAVFLPQVAIEQGWDRDETLCHLCQKAGLSENAWKDDGMEFYVFTADVFGEGEKS
ncbi:MAG: AmmeMemoRadiSam system protein B [Planctomycetota bacterium]